MSSALIGYTGFVGTTLLNQTSFDYHYRSTTIDQISGGEYDFIICAGAPAQKWLANREPVADFKNIERLIACLRSIRCKNFVLISTVDVFTAPQGVSEDSNVSEVNLHPYGRHRRLLEKAVEELFPHYLIVRLPGLVGPGLRKNIVYDLLHDNNVESIDSRAVFQYYPMVNLWSDIQIALEQDLSLIHLTAEPVSTADIARLAFGRSFSREGAGVPATYDMRSKHAALFGGAGEYQYSKRETIQAIRAYAQYERLFSRQAMERRE